ncbi:hypothetical protein CsSME_00025378 [Camellia sinensis var. sinensis]
MGTGLGIHIKLRVHLGIDCTTSLFALGKDRAHRSSDMKLWKGSDTAVCGYLSTVVKLRAGFQLEWGEKRSRLGGS